MSVLLITGGELALWVGGYRGSGPVYGNEHVSERSGGASANPGGFRRNNILLNEQIFLSQRTKGRGIPNERLIKPFVLSPGSVGLAGTDVISSSSRLMPV